LALTVAAASVGLAAVVAGIVPHVVEILHAHDEESIDLPPFASLAQESAVYDASGAQIARFRLEHIEEVTLDQVPEDVIAAILAVEDRVYWNHKGVNLRSLVRAILSNVSSGSAGQGASTVTQQVVKNEYLGGFPRDARYKVLQARYAVMLEKAMSKRQILERYVNTIYFGNNAYGIAAAAEAYFGKSIERLTLTEGAFLAGMIRSPNGYDPIRKPERSRNRFRVVMTRLAEEQLLSAASAEYLGETWPLPEIVKTRPGTSFPPTYFTSAIRDFLLEGSDILGDTPQERYNLLYRGGLAVYTTQDPHLQELAEQARLEKLPANSAGFDTAVVSLDSKSGAIRAMVGGGGFRPGQDEINMALRPRQTGSSIKIFILAAAIQAGAIADVVIDGTRGCVLPNPGNPSEPFKIDGGVAGKVGTLEEATWRSLNCAFARLSQIVGLNRVVDTATRMGVKSPLDAFASFATGANEITPLDMASGAQTIANRGLHHDPYYVERVVRTATEQELYRHYDPGTRVLDTSAADAVTSILKGVLTRGTAAKLGGLDDGLRPSAGKTGTQENNTNAWFVGYTPQLTTSVWVGNPRGYVPMVNIPEFVEVGVKKVQGSTFPAQIWKAFMEPAHIGLPIEDWPAPGTAGREPLRLYLPGNECLAQVIGPNGKPVPTTKVPRKTTTTTTGPDGSGPTTTFFRVSYEEIDSGTTVPANVVDPKWPLPMAATDLIVYPCEAGTPKPPKPPKVTTTTTGETTTTIDGSTTSVVGPTGPSTTTGQPTTTKPAGSTTTVTVPPTAGG